MHNRTQRTPAPRAAPLRARITACLLTCLLAPLATQATASDVYRWKDANGVTHYSDTKPPAQQAERLHIDADRPATGPAPVPLAPPPPAAPQAVANQPDILMYASPTCGWCRKAERYFAARGLSYRNIDITASDSNRKAYERAGGRGTPLIFVGGQRVQGFNEGRLDAVIGAAR